MQLTLLRNLPGRQSPTLLDDVVGMALAEVPTGLARLQVLVEGKVEAEAVQLAHRLAGSAASFGATSLRTQFQQMEKAVGNLNWEAAAQLRPELDRQWQMVRDALEHLQTVEKP